MFLQIFFKKKKKKKKPEAAEVATVGRIISLSYVNDTDCTLSLHRAVL